jgi:hypothetical protein
MPATMPTFKALATPIGFTSSRVDVQAFVVRVDGEITLPTSHSEPCMRLSPHTAPL